MSREYPSLAEQEWRRIKTLQRARRYKGCPVDPACPATHPGRHGNVKRVPPPSPLRVEAAKRKAAVNDQIRDANKKALADHRMVGYLRRRLGL